MANLNNLDAIHLFRDNQTGLYWYVNAASKWTQFTQGSSSSASTIYTADGTLELDRTVDGGGSAALGFVNLKDFQLNSNDKANLIGVNSAKVQATSGSVSITSDYANGNHTIIDGVKVYKALLTQTINGSDSGTLVIGKTYNIETLEVGDDFSNVGYTSEGVDFIATGTTPTVWSNGTFVLNITDSQPQMDVLVSMDSFPVAVTYNPVDGITYNSAGGLFLQDKTYIDGQTALSTTRTSDSVISYSGTNVTALSVLIEVYP